MIAPQRKENKVNKANIYLPIYEKMPEIDFSIDEIVSLGLHRSRFHESLRDINDSADLDEEDRRKKAIEDTFHRFFIPLNRVHNLIPDASRTYLPEGLEGKFSCDQIDQYGFYSGLLVSLRNEDAQRSFIQGECSIFRHRLNSYKVLRMEDIPSEIFTHSSINFNDYFIESEKGAFYRIPFQIIFPFIDVTKCNLHNGKVDIQTQDMISIFVSFYKIYLERRIAQIRKQKVHESDIFKVISSMYDEKIGAFLARGRSNWNTISLQDLDSIAHRSFPPCMYNMYTKLTTAHKLFHLGRLQLGLFLKGIGLSMNDSLKLWRDQFSKYGISLDQFERQYAYNIRYNYGKEGSGRNFSPYSCLGMIRMPSPAADQTHGCPFMQMRKEECKKILERMFRDSSKKFSSAECESLADKGQRHPQVACAELFNKLHDSIYEEGAIRHPCEYFNSSEEYYKNK